MRRVLHAYRGMKACGSAAVSLMPPRPSRSGSEGAPRVHVVVGAEHADVRPRASGTVPVGPAPVVLHVETAGRVPVADDLVDALAELRIRIGREASADAGVGRLEGLAAVLAQVVAARGDAEVDPIAVAQDGVQAEPAVSGLPLARVLVVADA